MIQLSRTLIFAAISGLAACNPISDASTAVPHTGVNLFGFANDMSIFGSAYSAFESANCNASYAAYPYVDPPEHYTAWRDLGFNMFRLPLGWQHAQVSLSGPLNETTMVAYDHLVKRITGDGNTVIIDIHNYARWYCSVIGQPAYSYLNPNLTVTDEDFIDLWTKLATRYKHNDKVIFELMNEPHDLDIYMWAATLQKTIDAIRHVTRDQKILIPGTSFARLSDWVLESAPALAPPLISDPANKTLYDFHQYFDDTGGSLPTCRPWNTIASQVQEVTNILRAGGVKGMLTEFGGGPNPGCAALLESMLSFMEMNRDVWQGWTAWGSWVDGAPLTMLSVDPKSPNYLLTGVLQKFAANRGRR